MSYLQMTTKNPNVHHGGGIIVVITINPVVITINPVVITINPVTIIVVTIIVVTIDDKDGFLVNSLGDEGMCEILMI
jgi:hypothetical protein